MDQRQNWSKGRHDLCLHVALPLGCHLRTGLWRRRLYQRRGFVKLSFTYLADLSPLPPGMFAALVSYRQSIVSALATKQSI